MPVEEVQNTSTDCQCSCYSGLAIEPKSPLLINRNSAYNGNTEKKTVFSASLILMLMRYHNILASTAAGHSALVLQQAILCAQSMETFFSMWYRKDFTLAMTCMTYAQICTLGWANRIEAIDASVVLSDICYYLWSVDWRFYVFLIHILKWNIHVCTRNGNHIGN